MYGPLGRKRYIDRIEYIPYPFKKLFNMFGHSGRTLDVPRSFYSAESKVQKSLQAFAIFYSQFNIIENKL